MFSISAFKGKAHVAAGSIIFNSWSRAGKCSGNMFGKKFLGISDVESEQGCAY
jgi:hypothetical protein